MPKDLRKGDRHLNPQFNVRLRDPQRTEVKHLAIDRGCTINQLVDEAFSDLLSKYRRKGWTPGASARARAEEK